MTCLIPDKLLGKEIGLAKKAGSPGIPRVGEATRVGIETGPDISSTFHTHPQSRIARFSEGDIKAFQKGAYGPETVHKVGGERWALTRDMCDAYGVKPPPFEPIVTEITQSSIPTTGMPEAMIVPYIKKK